MSCASFAISNRVSPRRYAKHLEAKIGWKVLISFVVEEWEDARSCHPPPQKWDQIQELLAQAALEAALAEDSEMAICRQRFVSRSLW